METNLHGHLGPLRKTSSNGFPWIKSVHATLSSRNQINQNFQLKFLVVKAIMPILVALHETGKRTRDKIVDPEACLHC